MADDVTLSHFAAFRLADGFWKRSSGERRNLLAAWRSALEEAMPRAELYQLYPTRGELDLLVWSAAPAEDPQAPAEIFARFARAIHEYRPEIRPALTLWGLTRPSPYTRRGSDRAIDAVAGEREPYLIVYPFTKTADWYLLDAEERQRVMGEHIRVGRTFADVRQLLLYSFGLQDQDFVVVYETADLDHFSRLVQELRGTEARRWTDSDTPILTAIHRPGDALLELVS